MINVWRAAIQHLRNFVIRLSVTQIVLLSASALPGIRFKEALFNIWLASLVFVILTAVFRPVLVALTLPFMIMSAGLFIFVIDGILLLLTDLLTGLEIAAFGWAILGSVIMSVTNIWVQSAFKRLGWMEREDEDDPLEIVSPGWLLRILLRLGLLFGIVFSASMAVQVALALSTVTGNLGLIGGAALLTLLLISLGVAWLVAEGLETAHRARFSMIVGALTTFIAVIGIGVVLALPVEKAAPLPSEPEVQYWNLSTGARLAYYYYPAVEERADAPIIYLHDGPGLAVLDPEREFYSQFARDGFDVYLYDQVGTGRSERLDKIGAYDIGRNVADLDAIRSELGVHEMILIGQGAGAELLARYMSRYPERVRQAVFISPTPMWDDEQFFYNYAPTGSALGPNPMFEPRLLLAAALASYGPQAAQNLASQEKMSVYLERSFNSKTWVCARHSESAHKVTADFNYYAQIRTELSSRNPPDPRPPLEDNLTSSIILASECDYIPWEVILQYKRTLLNDKVFYIEGAGHMINLTQPNLMADIIRAFLLDQPFPIAYHEGSANPRPLLSP